jgi:hypothetical protein
MTHSQLIRLSKHVDKTTYFNYSKKRTVTSVQVIEHLSLHDKYVPVETGSAIV